MKLRRSTPADAQSIATLMQVVFSQMQIPMASDELLARTTETFSSPVFHSEIAETLVAVADEEVVGIAFGYPSQYEKAVTAHWDIAFAGTEVRIHPDEETYPNEWYLEVLATSKAVRGRGIGSKLLAGVSELTRDAGLANTGLNVDLENPKAEKLYVRQGFERVGQVAILNHPYYHMQRTI